MTKVLVLYYSAYGHIETMANALSPKAHEKLARQSISKEYLNWSRWR
jgi:hypothetical protein